MPYIDFKFTKESGGMRGGSMERKRRGKIERGGKNSVVAS